jgi:predicted SAM-dependent methyltransferase
VASETTLVRDARRSSNRDWPTAVIRRIIRRLRRIQVERRERAVLHKRTAQLAAELAGGGTRLHVGASSVELPGWIDTDVSEVARCHLDAVAPWPIAPGSLSHVFADNFLEHLSIDDARRFLHEARRALRPGGAIRLTVPDSEAIARMYLEAPDAILERHRRGGYRVEHTVDVLRIAFMESGHYLGQPWDDESLSAELAAAGFVNLRRCRAGQSDDPVLRGLEARAEPIEDAFMLSLEAQRS